MWRGSPSSWSPPRAKAIRVPSGDQAGWTSLKAVGPPPKVTWVRPLPLGAAVKMRLPSPGRNREKAIRLPSGDQSGAPSKPPAGVAAFSAPPAASTMMLVVPPRPSRVKAIRLPSGDQAASQSSAALLVSWVRWLPSVRTFQSSASAPPSRLKAIQLPSGDHDGWKPSSVWGTKPMVPAAASRIQMPAVGPERWSATRVPSGDQDGAVSLVNGSLVRLTTGPGPIPGLAIRTSSSGPAPAERTNAIRPFVPGTAARALSWGPGAAARTPASRASSASRLAIGAPPVRRWSLPGAPGGAVPYGFSRRR